MQIALQDGVTVYRIGEPALGLTVMQVMYPVMGDATEPPPVPIVIDDQPVPQPWWSAPQWLQRRLPAPAPLPEVAPPVVEVAPIPPVLIVSAPPPVAPLRLVPPPTPRWRQWLSSLWVALTRERPWRDLWPW